MLYYCRRQRNNPQDQWNHHRSADGNKRGPVFSIATPAPRVPESAERPFPAASSNVIEFHEKPRYGPAVRVYFSVKLSNALVLRIMPLWEFCQHFSYFSCCCCEGHPVCAPTPVHVQVQVRCIGREDCVRDRFQHRHGGLVAKASAS